METKVNYPLVGGFVLVLGSALIAGVLWLASGGGFGRNVGGICAARNCFFRFFFTEGFFPAEKTLR